MNDILMDSLVILLIFIFFWKSKFVKPLKEFNNQYLSLESTRMIKGFLAIVIIFLHLTHETTEGFLFPKFMNIGFLAVSVFFFISAYGLQKRYMSDKDYVKHFLSKRISAVLIPYIVFCYLYWLTSVIFFNYSYSLKEILYELIIYGNTLVRYSWFVIAILIFYFAFYIFMKLCKNNQLRMPFFMFIYDLVWVFFCWKMGYGSWWYNSVYGLVLGNIYAMFENKILLFLKKHYCTLLSLSSLLLFLFFGVLHKKFGVKVPIITIYSELFFLILVILIMMKLRIGNKILDFLGKISYEIYLSHGLLFMILRSNLIWIHNSFLYSIMVIFGTILIAFLFHKIFECLSRKYKMLYVKEKNE